MEEKKMGEPDAGGGGEKHVTVGSIVDVLGMDRELLQNVGTKGYVNSVEYYNISGHTCMCHFLVQKCLSCYLPVIVSLVDY